MPHTVATPDNHGKKCFSDRVGCFTREKQLVLFETNNKTSLKYLLKMGDTKNQKLLESRKFNILLELSKQISEYLPLPEIIIVEYSILPVQWITRQSKVLGEKKAGPSSK